MSKWATARFVAWDGEGVTVRGRHRYIMLRSSANDGVTDAKGLSTRACLAALIAGFKASPNDWHVGFAFSYDVNMIVADIGRRNLIRLHRGRWVDWGGFRMRYRRAKSFTVQRFDGQSWRGGTVWDTFGFFQASFVRACESYGVGDPEVRHAIAAMKTARSTFKAKDISAIESYCVDECRLLVELMTKLKGYLDDAGLRLVRWDGAGAVAASLMRREGVKPMKAEASPNVQDAIQYAFAGGRIELVQYGHFKGEIHHYDINSAYPTALRVVPCLSHGKWRHLSGAEVQHRWTRQREPNVFGLYRIRWSFASGAPLYPFFWRAPDGRVFYPREGEGWYWWPEVDVALRSVRRMGGRDEEHALLPVLPKRRRGADAGRAGRGVLRGKVEVIESLTWESACDERPFHFIPPLFEQRRQWKKEGRGAEKVLKLGLNSLYGKCAQHVGGSHDEAPPWHQLEWAGYTTSATRAALFAAAMQAPESIVFLATDGIYSTKPLDVPLGKGLGEWDYQRHVGLTVVQSGVYWVDNDDGEVGYHRGFDPGSISRAAVLRGWRAGRETIVASSTRFIGMGQALAGPKQWARWRQWAASPRVLQLGPLGTKRMDVQLRPKPAAGLVPTVPYDPSLEGLGLLSTPAGLPWRTLPGPPPNIDESDDESEDALL